MKIFPVDPYFPEEDRAFILKEFEKILEGKGFLSNDKFNREFEEAYKKLTGAKYALTVNNGTSAIELSLRTLGLEGKDILMPTNTSAATLFAIVNSGNTPVLCDIGDDLSLDPDSVEDEITRNTGAVVTVHIGGFISPETYRLKEFCDGMEIYLIEDGAQSVGSSLNGLQQGNFGDMSTTSFFSTKVATTGEGGMVSTDEEFLYNKADLIRNQAKVREKLKGVYQNYHESLGYNYRMTEVQALMGLTQLARLEEMISTRKKIANVYDQELSGWKFFDEPVGSKPNWYKWIGKCKNREEVYKYMKEEGIFMGGMVYEIPLHTMPPFKQFAHGSLLNSELLQELMFCPPIHAKMTVEQAYVVCEKLKEVLR